MASGVLLLTRSLFTASIPRQCLPEFVKLSAPNITFSRVMGTMSTASPPAAVSGKLPLVVTTSDSADSTSCLLSGDGMTLEDSVASRSAGEASTSQPMACMATRLPPPKSLKRKAAEALLAARYSLGSSSNSSISGLMQQSTNAMSTDSAILGKHAKPATTKGKGPGSVAAKLVSNPSGHVSQSMPESSVLVKGCPSSCECQNKGTWCKHDVRIPHTNWAKVFDSNPAIYHSFLMGKGYERIYMPENLQVYVVSNPAHAHAALQLLRNSMQDRVVAIDLEWKPEMSAGHKHPVAVMQLASATVCVLLHVSAMKFTLPPAVKEFLSDSSITMVGFAWESADESKLQSTFGFGRDAFSDFVDLKETAQLLGYHNYGLARITKQVMGLTMLKNRKVQCSNWAASQLTMQQIKYASMDVFVTGQVFRGLRLWHSSPSQCPSCLHPVGAVHSVSLNLQCTTCSSTYADLQAYFNHCTAHGHRAAYSVCSACGRAQQQ